MKSITTARAQKIMQFSLQGKNYVESDYLRLVGEQQFCKFFLRESLLASLSFCLPCLDLSMPWLFVLCLH